MVAVVRVVKCGKSGNLVVDVALVGLVVNSVSVGCAQNMLVIHNNTDCTYKNNPTIIFYDS